jgi:Asp-tRNA(Asn)/Glu-tRNA(Gln) amidotransferase A subunit family amidase
MVITAKRQRRRRRTWEMVIALLHLATAADASTAERIRSGQTSSLEEVSRRLARVDAVLLPVWGRPAPLASEIPEIVTTSTLFAEAVRFMVPFNYADLPLVVVPAAVSRCRGGGACPYALRPRAFQLVGRNESILLRLAAAYELERGELHYPLDPKSSDAGAATLLFGGALLTLTAVVAGAFFLVVV